MDPITAAIVGALAGGAITGTGKIAEKALVDSYEKLKQTIKNKFGAQSEVTQAITKLEANPNSAGRTTSLQEEVILVQADRDAELLALAEAVITQIKDLPEGNRILHQFNVQTNYGAVGEFHGSVTFDNHSNQPTKDIKIPTNDE